MKIENIKLSPDKVEELERCLGKSPDRTTKSKYDLIKRIFAHACNNCKVVPATKRLKYRRFGALMVSYWCDDCLAKEKVTEVTATNGIDQTVVVKERDRQ
jgi:hypothetical protein